MKGINPITTMAATLFLGSAMGLADEVYSVDPSKSSIEWRGSKIGGAHTGTVALKTGYLSFKGDKLEAGSFEIDMTTIDTTDVTDRTKRRVDRHLLSKDFFAVRLFPAATLEIASVIQASEVGVYEVIADLSIKGISKEIRFTAVVDKDDNSASAKAEIVFDRSHYNVKYRSGSFFQNLGDKLIHDDVEVRVDLSLERDK
jgi:polyisoprenoid-binding protein YceI